MQVILELLNDKLNKTRVVRGAIFDLLTSQCDRHSQNIFIQVGTSTAYGIPEGTAEPRRSVEDQPCHAEPWLGSRGSTGAGLLYWRGPGGS